jgi:LytR cell envelope-related transcriptional attenuator
MNKLLLKTSIVICTILSIFMMLSFIVRLNSSPMNTNISEKYESNGFNKKIQLNILNASGEAGIASKTRNHLRQLGFDVVEIGNYETMLDSTIIIDRIGDRTSAYKISKSLGLNENRIETVIDSSLYLRATVVIGKDFSNLRVKL